MQLTGYTIPKRTYRAIYSQLHFSKYFYCGCIQHKARALNTLGSVCALLSGLSGMSVLLWLAVAPVLVKVRGLAT
jgi:hypothetical protein